MQLDPDLLALQEVRSKVDKAWSAFQRFRNFSQEQIDAIVERAAAAAREHAPRLAQLAVEETGMGNAQDKLIKNLLASDLLPRTMRGMKTVGVVREDVDKKVVEMAVPMGVVAAILPTTNPTSTAIYKTLIALKAGNSIVLSPHPRATRCTCETAAILAKAAEEAGAPEGTVACIGRATIESTNELMRHKRTAVILSTGGSGIVKAAYSSGKPAFGVGPGNVPVVIDVSADLSHAVGSVVSGKTFDYGTVCSSEQTIVAERALRDGIRAELQARQVHLCSKAEQDALIRVLLVPPNWGVNPQCVGQPAPKIARMAGFAVPDSAVALAVEIQGVGKDHPLSAEKLSPVLSLYFVESFSAALDGAEAILRFGGLGHTCAIYAKDDARIREYALRMPAMRVLANTPTPQGSTGITTNLFPAMTLGCGAVAGNSTGDNIGPQHLVNIKRLAYAVRNAQDAFETQPGAALSTERRPPAISPGPANAVSAAVEKFLAQRGFRTPKQDAASAEVVVDRFLNARRTATPRPEPPAAASPAPEPVPASPPQAAPPPSTPAPTVVIAPFVSEGDVRAALHKGQKIYIGPKSIVTPSARELGNQHDILVMAERK